MFPFNNLMNCFLPCTLADTASQTIGQCGGVKAVITTMRLFCHQVDIATACCNALWTLAVSGERATISRLVNGIKIPDFIVVYSVIDLLSEPITAIMKTFPITID